MSKHHSKLTSLFSFWIFIALLFIMVISTSITMTLNHFGLLLVINKGYVLINFSVIVIIVGSVLARIARKQMLAPILEISEATKEVAKGNFDITINKRTHANEINIMAENFLLMAKELANVETFHNDFINNVSHEFKTPLSAIEGYATLLQNKNLNEEKRNECIANILYSSKRLSSLTGNILQLARLESQEIMTNRKSFSLDEQIRQIVLMYEAEWAKKELNLEINLDPVTYFGNADLLAQVWQNLIGNAIKFVADKGNIRIILQKEHKSIRIFVSDDGIGMDKETTERVFEKFYQGDTSHAIEGNGLGLALAKRIIDLHKGEIELSSKKGKGTTFTVTLPLEMP